MMPDAPAAVPASPAPAAAPSTAPAITFGGGSAPAAPTAPAPPESTPGAGATPEAPEKIDFRFEGDEETYSFEDKPDDTQVAEQYDATKPFDPAAEAALKDHPEILKALKQGHYELRQWKGNGFKSPAELKAYKSRVEALGGPEKIEQQAGEWDATMTGFQNGDPSVLDNWGKQNPEGMVKLFPSMLTWLNTHNPGAYAGQLGKVMKSTLLHENDNGMRDR